MKIKTSDTAIIEERTYCSSDLQFKDPIGLPDIRVFCHNFEPVMSMLRYPTFESKGRSNLHRGGIGMGIDLNSGRITHIRTKGKKEEITREFLGIASLFTIPKWEEIKAIAGRASEISGLKIAGVDTVLDTNNNVLVLEINGRPGIEIQNINELSLFEELVRK